MIDFMEWLTRVDRRVQAMSGVSVYDIEDFNYRDYYDDGASVEETAQDALAEAGFDVDVSDPGPDVTDL